MAFPDQAQGPSWLRNPDPLGVGLKIRAANQGMDYRMQHLGQNLGPMTDPAWDGLFQALQEQGVDKVAQGSPFVEGPTTSTIDPSLPQRGLMEDRMRSTHIGNVLSGIKRATGNERRR